MFWLMPMNLRFQRHSTAIGLLPAEAIGFPDHHACQVYRPPKVTPITVDLHEDLPSQVELLLQKLIESP